MGTMTVQIKVQNIVENIVGKGENAHNDSDKWAISSFARIFLIQYSSGAVVSESVFMRERVRLKV